MADYFKEFIPEKWAAQILAAKDKVHVFGGLANRNYQGEIQNSGDTVRIGSIGEVTINDYTRSNWGTGLTIQPMDNTQLILKIDQEKYFTVAVDDVDIKQQATANLENSIQQKAGYNLGENQDKYLASLYTQAGINQGSTAIACGSSNIEDTILDLASLMDESNIQREGRYLVIPPWMHQRAVAAGIADKTANDQMWANGFAGRAYGFDLYMSNNVSNTASTSVWNCIAGVGSESLTIAEQIVKVTRGMLEDSLKGFGPYWAGLHVYGARYIPDRTAVLPVSKV